MNERMTAEGVRQANTLLHGKRNYNGKTHDLPTEKITDQQAQAIADEVNLHRVCKGVSQTDIRAMILGEELANLRDKILQPLPLRYLIDMRHYWDEYPYEWYEDDDGSLAKQREEWDKDTFEGIPYTNPCEQFEAMCWELGLTDDKLRALAEYERSLGDKNAARILEEFIDANPKRYLGCQPRNPELEYAPAADPHWLPF